MSWTIEKIIRETTGIIISPATTPPLPPPVQREVTRQTTKIVSTTDKIYKQAKKEVIKETGEKLDTARTILIQARGATPNNTITNTVTSLTSRSDLRFELEKAAKRNGADINDDKKLKEYHSSLEFDPNNPDERKIFRYFPPKSQLKQNRLGEKYYHYNPNESKPFIFLILGNKQKHTWDTGINTLAERFQEAGYHTFVFRTGDAEEELLYKTYMSNDSSLHTEIVYQHTKNIMDDALNRRGKFKDLPKSNGMIIGGYSFGGGTTVNLTHEYNGNIPIIATFTVDPVVLSSFDLGNGEKRRPRHSGSHFNAYQKNDIALRGGCHKCETPSDVSMFCPRDNHISIIENEDLQDEIFNFVTKAINTAKKKI